VSDFPSTPTDICFAPPRITNHHQSPCTTSTPHRQSPIPNPHHPQSPPTATQVARIVDPSAVQDTVLLQMLEIQKSPRGEGLEKKDIDALAKVRLDFFGFIVIRIKQLQQQQQHVFSISPAPQHQTTHLTNPTKHQHKLPTAQAGDEEEKHVLRPVERPLFRGWSRVQETGCGADGRDDEQRVRNEDDDDENCSMVSIICLLHDMNSGCVQSQYTINKNNRFRSLT